MCKVPACRSICKLFHEILTGKRFRHLHQKSLGSYRMPSLPHKDCGSEIKHPSLTKTWCSCGKHRDPRTLRAEKGGEKTHTHTHTHTPKKKKRPVLFCLKPAINPQQMLLMVLKLSSLESLGSQRAPCGSMPFGKDAHGRCPPQRTNVQ